MCVCAAPHCTAYKDWHLSELQLKRSCFTAAKWWTASHPVTVGRKWTAELPSAQTPIPCAGQTYVTYESIFNLLSTDLYSLGHCLTIYLSVGPPAISNQHCCAGITTWSKRAQYISGCIFHVFLAYNDFVLMKAAGASDLHGKQDNWLAWYSVFFPFLAKYTFVHSYDGTNFEIISTLFRKTMLDTYFSLLI